MSRIKILKNLVFVTLAIIAVRLFFIQIIEHDNWVAKANEQHTLLETITAKRGEIYMMDGDTSAPVVLNQTVYAVVIDPATTDKNQIQDALNKYAKEYVTANIDEVYNVEGLRYYIVAKNVPYSIAAKIAEEGIASVWLKESNRRVYPEGDMASTVLGFVNAEGIGQYGVEGSLNNLLAGKDGKLKTVADINKVALSIGKENVKIPAEDGKNIVLSIDRGLERSVEEITMEHLNDSVATKAAVLIMDPNTGEVFAMSTLPNYSPADYGQVADASAYVNQVTEVPYEPASICKSFAFSAAINEGLMDPETTYFNQGYEIIDDWPIKNAEQRSSLYGTINMRTAFYWSLNTGSIYALKLLGGDVNNINAEGRKKLYDYYYNKFRLGQATGIELIEAEGFIPDPVEGDGRDSTYANMTFGQNLGITMIQTATAFSAVVNGGTYRTPTIVKGVLENDEIVPIDSDSTEDKILSDETSNIMRDLLINNRTSKVLRGIDREGYAIGGKTGTAQVIEDGAYTMDEFVGSYIGFVGTNGELPKFVIMIKMWADGERIEGNKDPMNLFDSLSNFVIDYYKLKPNY